MQLLSPEDDDAPSKNNRFILKRQKLSEKDEQLRLS